MERICDLISKSETWLMERILNYAKTQNYTPYTSTLAEAWRSSIAGLSENLISCMRANPQPLEFSPELDYTVNPGTAFGINEARLHRARGIDLGMFLGLMKYYRQSYLDLLDSQLESLELLPPAQLYIARFFDAIEIGFITEWLSFSGEDLNRELQENNRQIIAEKNKYLTIYDSIPLPVILLDSAGRVENTNSACGDVLSGLDVSGATYYSGIMKGARLPFLETQIAQLATSEVSRLAFQTNLEIRGARHLYQVHIRRMLDVSEKFSGYVVILSDITEETRIKEALEYSERVANILLEAPQEFAILADSEGRVLAANKLARYHLGKYGEDIIGVSWKKRTDPRLIEGISAHWEEVIATGKPVSFEYQHGEDWRSCSIYPIINDDDAILEFAVFIRDITERRRAMDIQIEVERRAVEIATLRAAAGTTAHEINNPLTGIMAIFQEVMEAGAPEHQELARTGLAAAQRIKAAVEQMSRIRNPEYKPYNRDRMILDLPNTRRDPSEVK